jgi:CBS domain-containing protein
MKTYQDVHLAPEQGSYVAPSFEHATVRDAMREGVVTCPPEAPAVDVARLMATRHIHAVVVAGLQHSSSGAEQLRWGVASDLEVLKAAGAGFDTLTASDIATIRAIAVGPDTPLPEAARCMAEAGVSHLVVVEDGRPVGVVSTLDVAGVLAWGRA